MTRNRHGDYIWYELMTADPEASADFYSKVVGWTVERGESGYWHLKAGDQFVGGLLALTEQMIAGGARPVWLGYVGVNDVDDAVTSIEHGGGRVLMPATNIPQVGRIAMVADPQGAPFYVMRGEPDETSTSFSPEQQGHCSWNELATSDPDAAFHFYTARFGWLKGDSMPMGEMGDYQFITHGGSTIGAVMKAAPGQPSRWRYYFNVPDASDAADSTRANGGKVLHGPQEIPGGQRIIIGSDPQGAEFAVVGR